MKFSYSASKVRQFSENKIFVSYFMFFSPKFVSIFRENVKDLSISTEKITFCFPLFSAGSELANNHKKLSNLE